MIRLVEVEEELRTGIALRLEDIFLSTITEIEDNVLLALRELALN